MYSSAPLRLGWVPPLGDDELLYSWVGKLTRFCLAGPQSDRLRALCGAYRKTAMLDLPTGLAHLHQRLGAHSPLPNVEAWIDRTTLYPLHRPFIDATRDVICTQALAGDGGLALKFRLGRIANRFGGRPWLQLCTACAQADLTSGPVAQWRRSAHLPGVSWCSEHEMPLVRLTNWKRGPNPHLFEVVSDDFLSSPHAVDPAGRTIGVRFAKASFDLLRANPGPIGGIRLAEVYTRQARRIGIPMAPKTVRISALVESLRRHYADFEHLEHRDRLLSSARTPLQWVHTIFRRPETAVHPICHLLMIDFLFGTVGAWIEALQAEAPTPSADTLPSAPRVPAFRLRIDAQAVSDTSLSCRTLAARYGCSVGTAVALRRERGVAVQDRSSKSRAVMPALLEGLRRGGTLEAVALACNVSTETVSRAVRAHPAIRTAQRQANFDSCRDKSRTAWKALAEAGHARRAARKLDPGAYAWLYRNDREWLSKSQPADRKTTPRSPRGTRIDWDARDRGLAARATAIVQATSPPPSFRSVLLQLGSDRLIELHWQRLPLLCEALLGAEFPNVARRRRLREAFERLKQTDKEIRISVLEREARIHRSFRPLVLRWIAEEVTPSDGLMSFGWFPDR